MLNFLIIENNLILRYSPMNPWVANSIKSKETIPLKKELFIFYKSDISYIHDDEGEIVDFILGKLNPEGYFYVKGRLLGIQYDVYIYKDINISEDFFTGIRSISIFKEISKVVFQDIYIGGTNSETIPYKDFTLMLKEFPNHYEIDKYIKDRLSFILENYFDSASSIRGKYELYMNKKKSTQGEDLKEILRENEIVKYETILNKLEIMLSSKIGYSEKQWQIEILQIILLLYPKYVYAFDEAPVYDSYRKKDRRIDFVLVDSTGNVDIIEIKKPMDGNMLTKTRHRDNFIPLKELSGAVMQVEKYIYHLNKSGLTGELKLTSKYKSKIPSGFNIKITNPGGMIIMGRDTDLSKDQKEDLEIIKRKYKNVIDIITYDDLLRRLKFIISAWRTRI